MSGLARWCFQHRRWVAAAWLLAMVAVVGLGKAAGTDFGSSFSLPNTDSQAAVSLLTQNFPAASGEGDQIVIQATHGATIRSAPVRAEVTAALAKVAAVPGVEAVASPYAKADAAQISRDGRIAFAVVTWDKQAAQVTNADADHLIKAAESADGATVHISLSGQSITNSERPDPGFTVAVGVIAALAVLLVVFGGALLAALLPLLGAIVALVLGNSLIGLLSHAMSISSVSTELAVLIGLGVGVDYGLFIISRYRSAVKQGTSYADAAAAGGRDVRPDGAAGRPDRLHRPARPVPARRQLPLRGVGLRRRRGGADHGHRAHPAAGHARVPRPAGPVPAGTPAPWRPDGTRARPPAGSGSAGPGSSKPARSSSRSARSPRWSRSRCRSSACALAPRTPAPTRPSSTTHQAYTALAEGFGPGFNGPLELVARSGSAADVTAFDHLLAVAARTPGVASVAPAVTSPNGKVAARHRLPDHQPAGHADHQPGERPARPHHPAGGRRHQPGRPRRRGDGDQHRLRARADGQAADLHRHRRAAGVPAADGRLPQPADPAGGVGR